MTRLDDRQLAELKNRAEDLRKRAKRADDSARADREKGDYVGERIWKLQAKTWRREARESEEAARDERLSRRIDRTRARLGLMTGNDDNQKTR